MVYLSSAPLVRVGHETQTGGTRPRVWLVGGRPKPALVTYGMVGGIKTTRKGVPRYSVCTTPDGGGGRTQVDTA
ncbi:hypothetical protein RHS04_03479 [Rhizoctonia solani]|uniref:Uncharacterized protein n=1 Tax=Rhizoctonia solani TaxID=456999 RepID=A0A8H7HD88_9AGAM|nr:hypothetical protein RHS04_03479 [Rhizoctonia solani]